MALGIGRSSLIRSRRRRTAGGPSGTLVAFLAVMGSGPVPTGWLDGLVEDLDVAAMLGELAATGDVVLTDRTVALTGQGRTAAGVAGRTEDPAGLVQAWSVRLGQIAPGMKDADALAWFTEVAPHVAALTTEAGRLGLVPPPLADLAVRAGLAMQTHERHREARTLFQSGLILHEALPGPDPLTVASVLCDLAHACEQLDDADEAIVHYRRALEIRSEVLGREHIQVATTLANLGTACFHAGHFDDAVSNYVRALDVYGTNFGPGHPNAALILRNLAECRSALGAHDEAVAAFAQALAMIEAAFGSQHHEVVPALNGMAGSLTDAGRHIEALAVRRRVVVEQERLGSAGAELADALARVGDTHEHLSQPEDARTCRLRAVQILEGVADADPALLSRTLTALAGGYVGQGDDVRAEQAYGRALQVTEASYGPDHPQVGVLLANLGDVSARRGDPRRALDLLERARPKLEVVFGPDHPQIALVISRSASCHLELGHDREAIEQYRRSCDIIEQAFGPDHPGMVIALSDLGSALARSGQQDQAETCWARAYRIVVAASGPEHPNARRLQDLLDRG
jgi:tetratricopeptide (TPR) repeat protein